MAGDGTDGSGDGAEDGVCGRSEAGGQGDAAVEHRDGAGVDAGVEYAGRGKRFMIVDLRFMILIYDSPPSTCNLQIFKPSSLNIGKISPL